jgi:hypothetical protein
MLTNSPQNFSERQKDLWSKKINFFPFLKKLNVNFNLWSRKLSKSICPLDSSRLRWFQMFNTESIRLKWEWVKWLTQCMDVLTFQGLQIFSKECCIGKQRKWLWHHVYTKSKKNSQIRISSLQQRTNRTMTVWLCTRELWALGMFEKGSHLVFFPCMQVCLKNWAVPVCSVSNLEPNLTSLLLTGKLINYKNNC